MKNIFNNSTFKNILRPIILIFVIMLIIFLIGFSFGMSNIDFNLPFKENVNNIFNIKVLQMQFVFAILMSFVLSLIPFFKRLSIVTIFYSYYLSFSISNIFYIPNFNKLGMIMFTILSLITLSIVIVICMEISKKINHIFYKKIGKTKEEYISSISKKQAYVISAFAGILTIVSLIITKYIM